MKRQLMKQEIFEKAHLNESSNLAREYFSQCSLKIENINKKDCEKLSEFITTEINLLLTDKTYSMVRELRMNKKILVDKYGIYLFTDGSYFSKRQAISFEHDKSDGYKFIGFCGWASGCNRIPYLKGFINWCDSLSPTSQTSPNGDFSNEKEHNISLKESANTDSQISSNDETSLNNHIPRLRPNFIFGLVGKEQLK